MAETRTSAEGRFLRPEEVSTGPDGEELETATGRPVQSKFWAKMSKSKHNGVSHLVLLSNG